VVPGGDVIDPGLETVAGTAVPPATDAIAVGVADALGGAGYVVVGPVPANASGDGSLFLANIFMPGTLRHPVDANVATAHVINSSPRV
jgi:hypothetical protein